jgi:hypothetical protein
MLRAVRGRSWGDTLALGVNGLIWMLRRWYLRRKLREVTLFRKELQEFSKRSPHKHWLNWPFPLKYRWYKYEGLWVDAFGLSWFWVGQKEDIPPQWLGRLHTGKVGIDIGAHRGYWTLFYSQYFPPGSQVFLLEPEPENYAFLLHNLSLNKATYAIPLPVAAWSRPTLAFLQRSFFLPS